MIHIYTLGDFDIKVNDVSILQSIGNQHVELKLFKYFLTFHGEKLLAENIIEDIWQDSDYENPINELKTQISRIKNMFEEKGRFGMPFFNLDYIDGYYLFEISKECSVDFLDMQECIDRGCPDNSEEASDYYRKVVDLYRGEYLRELGEEEWLIPIRSRFDSQYIGCLAKYLLHLMHEGKYVEILSISEEAMLYKPYEEILHMYHMDALLKLGQWDYAKEHYINCTTRVYKELGKTPSYEMKELYKRITHNHSDESNIDSDYFNFNNGIMFTNDGCMICEKTEFMSLCSFELRNKDRFLNEAYLGEVTINNSLQDNHSDEIKYGMQLLMNSMRYSLRKGDALSQWNEKQLMVLFHSLEEKEVDAVVRRIRQDFDSTVKNKNLHLNIKLKKI